MHLDKVVLLAALRHSRRCFKKLGEAQRQPAHSHPLAGKLRASLLKRSQHCSPKFALTQFELRSIRLWIFCNLPTLTKGREAEREVSVCLSAGHSDCSGVHESQVKECVVAVRNVLLMAAFASPYKF